MSTLDGIRSIDELRRSTGKRVFIRVDFNVPARRRHGKITDDARIREALPTIKHRDGGGREGDPRVAPRPAQGQARSRVSASSRAARASPSSLDYEVLLPDDCIGDAREEGRPRPARRPGLPAREPALPRGRREGRRGLRARARRALRRLRQRRVRRRAPRARLGARAAAADARARRGPPAARRSSTRSASCIDTPEQSVRRGARRRQGQRQDRRHRGAARARRRALHRRRDGQHVPRRAGHEHARRRASRRTSSRSRARILEKARDKGVELLLPVDVVVAQSLDATSGAHGRPSTRSPTARWRSTSARRRSSSSRSASPRRRRCSGTARWACSRTPPFAEGTFGVARAMADVERLHRGRRRRQRRGREAAGDERREEDRAHLDRRRRVARAHRRQEAPGRRGASRRDVRHA